jgi:ABC-2 type transport system permease protein
MMDMAQVRSGVFTEVRKLAAFLRRDALIAWSYRRGAVSELVGLLGQAGMFYFFSFLVDQTRMPQLGGTRADYLAFVIVGLTVATFYQTGVGRMMSAVRNEQLMGTFEALLMTPTALATLQLGFVIYDLIHIPVRAALFLGLAVALFGIDLDWAGTGQALAVILALLPFIWGVAAGLTAVVVTFRQATYLIAIANFALVVGSGTYFPLSLFPRWFAAAAAYNPLALTLSGARGALLGGEGWGTVAPQILLILAISIPVWMLGMLAFRAALERERNAGTLGLY